MLFITIVLAILLASFMAKSNSNSSHLLNGIINEGKGENSIVLNSDSLIKLSQANQVKQTKNNLNSLHHPFLENNMKPYIRLISMALFWSFMLFIMIMLFWPMNINKINLFSGLFSLSYDSLIMMIFLILVSFSLFILTTNYAFKPHLLDINLLKDLDLNLSKTENKLRIMNSIVKQDHERKPEACNRLEYYIVFCFAILGGVFLITSNDLISMFISLELQSYALYILASINRKHSLSASSGLKYFLLGGLSSGFILLGIALIYVNTGLSNLESLALYLNVDLTSSSYTLKGAMLLILVGFLFKIAAVPFHNWSPDVYDGVPTLVTAFISIMPKIPLIYFLCKFIITVTMIQHQNIPLHVDLDMTQSLNVNFFTSMNFFILISSFLSLIVGSILGLSQERIKRLFAYSSISNIGFILLSLAISSMISIHTVLFYLITYTIMNLNLFFILIAFGNLLFQSKDAEIVSSNFKTDKKELSDFTPYKQRYSPLQKIGQLNGQWFLNSFLVLSFTLTLFSLAGIPPLIGFYSKLYVLYSAVNHGYLFLSFIAIISSVLAAAYYLNIVKVMFLAHAETEPSQKENNNSLDNFLSLMIAIFTLVIALFILKPAFLLNLSHILSLMLYNI